MQIIYIYIYIYIYIQIERESSENLHVAEGYYKVLLKQPLQAKFNQHEAVYLYTYIYVPADDVLKMKFKFNLTLYLCASPELLLV